MLKPNVSGFFPYTPATNLLYGLREALAMLLEEGLEAVVFARHQRLAGSGAGLPCAGGVGLEVLCLESAEYSPVLTAVLMPPGHDADHFRKVRARQLQTCRSAQVYQSLPGRSFASVISGECNELTLMAALTGVENGTVVQPGCLIAAAAWAPLWRSSRDVGATNSLVAASKWLCPNLRCSLFFH